MSDFEKWFKDYDATHYTEWSDYDLQNAFEAGREAAFDLVIERSADFDSHESFITWCRLKRAGK